MRREIRQVGVVSLLLLSLLHAWFSHDHDHPPERHQGHHHHNIAEAAHTKAVRSPDAAKGTQLATVALLVTLFHFALPQPEEDKEAPQFEVALRIEPQFCERPQSPRAPPLRFSFV